MADLEVRKHAKNALQSITKKDDKGIWHKMKEFLLEILIIVFAVSLSIWLHGLSEKSHQAEEVRDFLTDLKSDLDADRQEILNTQKTFPKIQNSLNTEKQVITIPNDNQRSVYLNIITRKTNSGNYEGFKSSGNISFIKNKNLKNKILKYYEQDIKSLEEFEKIYNNQMDKVMDKVLDNSLSQNSKNLNKNIFFLESYRDNVLKKYDKILLNIDTLKKEIKNMDTPTKKFY